MIGLIPASGKSSRFGGLPKFALPCDIDNKPILKRQVDQMSFYVDEVVVSVPLKFHDLVKSFKLNAEIVVIEPATMNYAVINMAEQFKSDKYLIGMADTYFKGENPYLKLSKYTRDNLITLACWPVDDVIKGKVGQVELVKNKILDIKDKDQTCDYPHMWGAIGLDASIINKMDKFNQITSTDIHFNIVDNFNQHYAFEVDGKYFDIGTLANYRNLLNSLELE